MRAMNVHPNIHKLIPSEWSNLNTNLFSGQIFYYISWANCYVNNQVGRVVKAPDLSSGPRMGSWVQTPHLVNHILYVEALRKFCYLLP